MDEGKTYVNVKFIKTDPQSPFSDGLTSSYSELNFQKEEPLISEYADHSTSSRAGEQPIIAEADALISTYSELNFRRDDSQIDESEDPSIASGPGGMPTTTPTAAPEQESKAKSGNKPYRLICLLCLVTFALIVTVAGLSIHVSQFRRSQMKRNEDYKELNATQSQCLLQVNELNSTLQSKISKISHLELSQGTCLKNLSELDFNLSDSKRMYNDLRHQLTEMETKYRSVNETKAQICELLTSRREQACSQNWIRNEDRCYFISTSTKPYDAAKKHCSNFESILLEINSTEEENFVKNTVSDRGSSYWIGKCKAGEVAANVVYTVNGGKFECSECGSSKGQSCNNHQHLFICEKSAAFCPDVPEEIQDLCQQPVK